MAHRRAGGYIDRGDGRGWVLDDTPASKPPKATAVRHPVRREPFKAGGWVFTPPPAPGAADPVEDPATEPVPVGEPGRATPTNAEVRAWARDQGIDVPARGRVPDDLVEQYLAATKE